MPTESRADKRSAQPSAVPASKRASRQASGQPPPSRQPTQAASRAQNGGATRAGTRAKTRAEPSRALSKIPGSQAGSKPASKAGSKAGTRQGTRASQKKPADGGVLAAVGEDGQIIVGGGEGGEDGREGDEDDDEYYDDDEEYDEDGEEEGEAEPEEEEEEEEDEFDYATYQYRPYQQYVRNQDEPRATIDTGPEGCSCFPTRSSRNIPSMLYEKVDCHHQGLQGYAQLGVFRFDDNWDNRNEATVRPKLADRLMPNKGYIWGYPNFVFVESEEDRRPPEIQAEAEEGEDEDYYDDDDGGEERDDYEDGDEYDEDGERYDDEGDYDDQEEEEEEEEEEEDEDDEEEELGGVGEEEGEGEREGYYDEYGDYHLFEDGESLPSRMYNSRGSLLSRREEEEEPKPPSTAPKPSSALEAILPKIGFTPEPSEHASRAGTVQSLAKPLSLPALSPGPSRLSGHSQYSYAPSREKTPVRFKPRTLHRTFQGKYYDPVTKQSYEFEITPEFRRRIDRWNVKKEGLGRFEPSNPPSARESAASQRGGSQASRRWDKEMVSRW